MSALNLSRVDSSSRISIRALGAGVVSIIGIMLLFEFLAAGFGLWSFNLTDYANIKAGFWFWIFAGEIISSSDLT